jgi:hypothetical protein
MIFLFFKEILDLFKPVETVKVKQGTATNKIKPFDEMVISGDLSKKKKN